MDELITLDSYVSGVRSQTTYDSSINTRCSRTFFSSTEDAQVIFRDAGEYNMTGEGHVWIVTEQALHANNTPHGVLGLQLEHAHSDKGHIRVSGMKLRTVERRPHVCSEYHFNYA